MAGVGVARASSAMARVGEARGRGGVWVRAQGQTVDVVHVLTVGEE